MIHDDFNINDEDYLEIMIQRLRNSKIEEIFEEFSDWFKFSD
jgi:hypothetical protein